MRLGGLLGLPQAHHILTAVLLLQELDLQGSPGLPAPKFAAPPSARNQGRQSIQSPWVHCNPLPTTDPLLLGEAEEEHSKPHPRAERVRFVKSTGIEFVSATSNLCDFGLVKKPLCLHFLICKMELVVVSTTQADVESPTR